MPTSLVLNIDQTPMFSVTHPMYTVTVKDAKHVPIRIVDDKC